MIDHVSIKTASGLNPKIASRNVQFWNSSMDYLEKNHLPRSNLRGLLEQEITSSHRKLISLHGGLYSHFQLFDHLFPTPRCAVCNVRTQSRIYCSSRCTYFSRTGYWTPSSNPDVAAKKAATTMKNWGVSNPFQSKELINKAQDSRELKTGYRHARQSPVVNKAAETKRNDTMLDRYGVESAIQIPGAEKKRQRTNIKNFGVRYPVQRKDIADKMIKTREERCMVKHGVRHILQTHAGLVAHMKACHALKTYKFKGREFTVQSSYEKHLFEKLAVKYGVHGVHTQFHDEFPRHTFSEAGTTPDLYVPTINKFVEVKSVYTFMYKVEWLRRNRQKAWNCNNSHCPTQWIVITDMKKGKLCILPKNWPLLTDLELNALLAK